MSTRKPFGTDAVPEIDAHIQERLREVEQNFSNPAYPEGKNREINVKIVFEPDKHDPSEITTKIFSECKLPKRYGKKVSTVLKDGRILVEDLPKDKPLFDNITNLKEVARD